MKKVNISWPNNKKSSSIPGSDWLKAAFDAGVEIPTGCMGGSCGACEIEVNGEVIRACVNTIKDSKKSELDVQFFYDPFW